MKFKIFWYEYHDPLNWANCPKLEEERDKLTNIPLEKRPQNFYEQLDKIDEKIRENGIGWLYSALPTKDIHLDPNEDDGWVECNCQDEFEANNIEKAKEYVIDNYDIQTEVFTVFAGDSYADAVFTEEDL